ncbi:MAG: helix-hairpin-helix domain-containing protein, partial [Terriglobia bacterium]
AGITNVEKLAGMTPEQLMEIPGIGEKMVDKIYQAVNRFYEGGPEAAAAAPAGENTDDMAAESEAAAPDGEPVAESAETAPEFSENAAPVDEAASAATAEAEEPTATEDTATANSEGEAKAEEPRQ